MIGLALEKAWHPIAWSGDLKRKPIAAVVLNQDVVAFRDETGVPHVMVDRCPHKGVKLSPGRCTKNGIECPYHGWIFNGNGEVVFIPSLAEGDKKPQCRIPRYTTVEQQGTVWFTFSDEPYEPQPPMWHFYENHSFTTIIDMDCEYVRLMENLVDNPHAGYIHQGLLRGKPSSPVTSIIRETNTGVHIQTIGEKARRSLVYNIFGERDRDIYHTEEYIAPNIIRTIFSHSDSTHASSQFVCIPVTERKTRVFYRITLDFFCARAFIPLFKLIVDKIIRQDRDILEHEAIQEQNAPNFKRITCKPDIPYIWVARVAKEYAEKGPEIFNRSDFKSVEVKYFL